MTIQAQPFVRAVRARAGLDDDAQAERAIGAVLAVVGERLFEIDARVLAEKLPSQWAALIEPTQPQQEFDVDELYRRVAERAQLALGYAMEQTQVVCQVLTESVDDSVRKHLRMRVSPDVAELFSVRAPDVPLTGPVGAPATARHEPPRQTLASGRPGSRKPVAAAAPRRAHTDSLAASDDPHGDTKLASSRGISTVRRGEDLADGGAPSDRSLADHEED